MRVPYRTVGTTVNDRIYLADDGIFMKNHRLCSTQIVYFRHDHYFTIYTVYQFLANKCGISYTVYFQGLHSFFLGLFYLPTIACTPIISI